MNPAQPESFNHRTTRLSTGRTYHFVDQVPANYDPKLNSTILCVHGFPDSWYGWRYQIAPWVKEGCRVVVPEMLGYGETDKPFPADEYTTKKLCADLAALLDLINVKRAVVIGHDWGSHTVGRFALWYPNRLLALVMLSVPYTPPSPVYLAIEDVAKKAPNLGYQVYFASQKSTKDIEANLKQFLDIIYRTAETGVAFTEKSAMEALLQKSASTTLSTVLSPKEFDYYYTLFQKGMNGPLNYYRTSKQRHDEELAAGLPSNLPSDLPVLFLWGTKDPTATPFVIRKAGKFITRFRDIAIEGKGHWLMVEAKDEVTTYIADWLKRLRSSATKSRL